MLPGIIDAAAAPGAAAAQGGDAHSNTKTWITRDGIRAWEGASRGPTLRLFRPPRQAQQDKPGTHSHFRLEPLLSQRRGTWGRTFYRALAEPYPGSGTTYSKLD